MQKTNSEKDSRDSVMRMVTASALLFTAALVKDKSRKLAWCAAAAGTAMLSRELSFGADGPVDVTQDALLGTAYFGLMPLAGVATRLMGGDPLRRRTPPAESYWIQRSYTKQTSRQFERNS
jgi:hypothetical protein